MCFIPYILGNYGNQIDGVSKPSPSSSGKKKKREGAAESDEEESELIQQHSSDEDADDSADLVSVSSTPVMKPVITDRSGVMGSLQGQGVFRVKRVPV